MFLLLMLLMCFLPLILLSFCLLFCCFYYCCCGVFLFYFTSIFVFASVVANVVFVCGDVKIAVLAMVVTDATIAAAISAVPVTAVYETLARASADAHSPDLFSDFAFLGLVVHLRHRNHRC